MVLEDFRNTINIKPLPQGRQEPVPGIAPGTPECVQQSEEGIVLDAKAVRINRQLGPCYPQRLPVEKSDENHHRLASDENAC